MLLNRFLVGFVVLGLFANESFAVKISRKLTGFTGINAYGPFFITVAMGKVDSVELEGDQKLLDATNTTIDRYQSLHIRLNPEVKIKPKQVIKFNITTTQLDNFNLGGEAKATVTNFVQTGSFRILGTDNSSLLHLDVGATTINVVLTGWATVKCDFHATVFQAVLSANTTFNASGAADVVTVEVGGTSAFYGSKLKGGFVTGSLRGKSIGEFSSNNEMKVAVYDQARVKTSGAGDLTKSIYNGGKWSPG